VDKDRFPEFPYSATEVVRYIQANELFSCLLSNGRVVHFCPNDVKAFKTWLAENGIEDVRG
jgi:hypothetical protein